MGVKVNSYSLSLRCRPTLFTQRNDTLAATPIIVDKTKVTVENRINTLF